MAFSKADRVMISRGRMFFSSRVRITGPMESHSSCFSCDSAGKDDEPGSVIPKASAALAMVFAVYICVVPWLRMAISNRYLEHSRLRMHQDLGKHAGQCYNARSPHRTSSHLANMPHTPGMQTRRPVVACLRTNPPE